MIKLTEEARAYLRTLAPHVKERKAAKLIQRLVADNDRLEKMLELQYKGKIGSKYGFAPDGDTPQYWPSVNGTCWSRKSYDTPLAALEAAMTEWKKRGS